MVTGSGPGVASAGSGIVSAGLGVAEDDDDADGAGRDNRACVTGTDVVEEIVEVAGVDKIVEVDKVTEIAGVAGVASGEEETVVSASEARPSSRSRARA